LSNIRVVKTALNGGSCYKVGFAILRCDYEIEIINDGPSPYFGAVTFDDTFPAAATLVAPFPAGWGCVFGPPLTCTNPFVAIPVGGSLTFPVSMTVPLAPLEIAGCILPNTATLTAPPAGTDPNFFGGDDTSTAFADAFIEWILPTGEVLVTCDPTNLKVTKVAQGDFVASDGGYRGEYTVTVTNMGSDPYKGPIEIDETFGFAPSSVTFSPEWGHSGGGSSYHLTLPNVDLDKGESVELKVTATVPEGKQCELKNTAELTRPEANTRWNKDPSDDAATAWATIPAKSCVKPDRPQCEPGTNEFRSESGACVCKSGYVRDEKGHCVGVVEAPRCPDGKPVPKSGRCPEAPPLCEPGPNEQRNAQGQCVCKSGYERDKNGRCVEPPTQCIPGPNEERNAQGQCVCKSGYERDKNGRCVAPPSPEDECEDRGWIWDDRTDRCLPPPNPEDECEARGWVWDDKYDRCSPPRNPEDECRQKGWRWDDKYERCLPPTNPAEECRKKGWTWDGKRCLNPADACKARGWKWDDGRCLPPTSPAEECRKKGWTWDGKRCLSPADACKAKGWKWDDGRCLPPTSPAEECRKKGWTWDGKRCLSPADACKAKGWKWDDGRCLPPTSPAEECRKKGWTWDGKRCLSPADACKLKGWKWDDGRCLPPTSPAEECRKKGRVWDGKQCLSQADICKAKGWNWDGKTKTCKPPAPSLVPRTPNLVPPTIIPPKTDIPR
jgi:hypothetical protein